jgi:hypothetical protein
LLTQSLQVKVRAILQLCHDHFLSNPPQFMSHSIITQYHITFTPKASLNYSYRRHAVHTTIKQAVNMNEFAVYRGATYTFNNLTVTA